MPKTVSYTLTRMHGGKPWMTAFDNQFVQAAGRAIERGFGKRPVFNREGGSIPVVATFQEELGLPCVLFGVGLPDENAHAPDEKIDLGNFHNGVIASAALYEEIGCAARGQSDAPVAVGSSVERRDPTAQRLHVIPHLRGLLAGVLAAVGQGQQPQVLLEIAQRGRVVVQVIGEQPAIAQLLEG